jgi:hypothetical protein
MKLIKSATNDKLYFTKYKAHECKETEISLSIHRGSGKGMRVFLSMNKGLIGVYDLLSAKDRKEAYGKFCSEFDDNEQHFKSYKQFSDAMVKLAKKLEDSDWEEEGKHKVVEFSPEIGEMLMDRGLMNQIDVIIRMSSKKGFVREYDNLATAYLTMISGKTLNPVNLDLTGATSVGKSYIVVRATIAFNRDFVDVIIGGSKTSYKYQGSKGDDGKWHIDLHNKSIVILESSEAEELIQAFKAIMSHDTEDDTFEIPVTGKNEVTGDMETRWMVFEGIPSFIMLGTTTSDQDEYLSRTLRAAPEISQGKINESVDIGFDKWAKPEVHTVHPKLQILKDSMSWIKRHPTVNIFSSVIKEIFPKDDMIRNRDRDKLIGLIESITMLHQLQRPKYKDFLMVSLEDNIIGLMLMDKMLDATLAGLSNTTLNIYETMKEMENPPSGGTVVALEEPKILDRVEATGNTSIKSLTSLGEHLTRLVNHHLIEVRNSGRGSIPRSYHVLDKEDLKRLKLTPLFLEKVAKDRIKIMKEYSEVISECELPESPLPLNTYLIDNEIDGYLMGLNYFVKDNIDTPIYYITPDNLRDKLFSDRHVLEISDNGTTNEFEKRKKDKEQRKKDIISGEAYADGYIPPDNEIEDEEEEYEYDEEYDTDFLW